MVSNSNKFNIYLLSGEKTSIVIFQWPLNATTIVKNDTMVRYRFTLSVILNDTLTYRPACNEQKFSQWKRKVHLSIILFGTLWYYYYRVILSTIEISGENIYRIHNMSLFFKVLWYKNCRTIPYWLALQTFTFTIKIVLPWKNTSKYHTYPSS